MLRITFIQKLSSKSLRKSYITQKRCYLISVKHIRIQSKKKTKIIEWKTSLGLWTTCRGSSEFPVLPSLYLVNCGGELWHSRQLSRPEFIGGCQIPSVPCQVARCCPGKASYWLCPQTAWHNFCSRMRSQANGTWEHLSALVLQGSQARTNTQGI